MSSEWYAPGHSSTRTATGAATWLTSCRGILLDLDGTLVDSTTAILRAWRTWAASVGADPHRLSELVLGRAAADIIQDLLPAIPPQFVPGHVRHVLELQETDPAPGTPFPGAAALGQSLVGSRWGVVTGCSAELARVRLASATVPVPPVLVTDEDVHAGKPHPAGYLLALERLGLTTADVVVVEDSPVGVQAGKDAGMRVIAVATTNPPAALSAADWVVADLAGLRLTAEDEQRLLTVHADLIR
jgi:sugar-phosphatase